MTINAGLALCVARKQGTPKPHRDYGPYLEARAKVAKLTRDDLVRLTGLGQQQVWRNLTAQPGRSMIGTSKIRDEIRKRGVDVDPVPSESEDWEPGVRVAIATIDDPLRRNLVNFREEAGLGLHEAAAATGVPLETLKAYELGKADVPSLHLIRLAEAYGRPAEHFAREAPPPRGRKPPPRATIQHFDVEQMTPAHRERVLEMHRELERINDAERARAEQQRKGKR